MSEPRVTLLVRVSPRLKARLEEMAKSERRSLSKQVELLLEKFALLDGESSVSAQVYGTGKKKKSRQQ